MTKYYHIFIILLIHLFFNNISAETGRKDFKSTLGHLIKHSRNDKDAQAKAFENLLQRVLPSVADSFKVLIKQEHEYEKDYFQLSSFDNGSVLITASTGVAAASGLNYYLKYYCNCHISWEVNQLNVPNPLPKVNKRIVLNDMFRYYQNVCTTSYSFVWWDWNQWEKHIDWIVMNSFNLVLAFNGQEAIWERVYRKFNLTRDDIDEHVTGPAFLSWLRMGNMRKWGGPLSFGWNERSLVLQHKILDRLRSFGVITVLPAFAGHLPRAFKRLFPNANMVKLSTWNDFNDTYCCPYFLDPTEELFNKIGTTFINEQVKEFGTDHIYSCDSFNENIPPSGNENYLFNVSQSIFNAMTGADPEAIWLMQNWLFVHDAPFWTKSRAKALITAVPQGKMIILDLQSEQWPQYENLDQYFGQPYIWCMLHNFGGTLGMYGNSDIINERPIEARNHVNSSMIGTGITMEGINQNYVIYDLMTETSWRRLPCNLTEWFSNYTLRRYGKRDDNVIAAWTILQKTVYNLKGLIRMRGKYAVTRTPSWNFNTWLWYDKNDLFKAWKNMLAASKGSSGIENMPGFLHDLVDITRESLQVANDALYPSLKISYRKRSLSNFRDIAEKFLTHLKLMENILASNKAFLLSEWIKSARSVGRNDLESNWYEYNARNQITLWGPNGEIMNYAIKQWSGVVSDFLYPRWKVFLDYAAMTLEKQQPFNNSYISDIMFKTVEEPFTFKKMQQYKGPRGDTLSISEDIMKYVKHLLEKDNTKLEIVPKDINYENVFVEII